MFRRLDLKILAVIGTVVTLGLAALVIFYSDREERNILAQNQRTLLKLVDSTRQELKTLMLSGYGDMGPVFAESLEGLSGVADLRVVRTDGSAAFADNRTLERINRQSGYERFYPREVETPRQVLPSEKAELKRVLKSGKRVQYYGVSEEGERLYTLLEPVSAEPVCRECHLEEEQVLGVIKLTTSLAEIDANMALSRLQSMLVMAVTVLLIMAVIRVFLMRNLVRPVGRLTRALQAVSDGELRQQLTLPRHTEMAVMADSFNRMSRKLADNYAGLQQERNTLTTIIQGAREGMVATDESGRVVLVNPMALTLLGKGEEEIRANGFQNLFDDPAVITRRLAAVDGKERQLVIEYNQRMLSVQLATIEEERKVIGSAALIRDITEEIALRRQLHHESHTDGLTGLSNRRYFDRQLEHELLLAQRYDRPMALILFDVDHFKAFNDQHGHEQGDRVLRQIADVARKTLRKGDILCRYGGEEFVAIMPNLNEQAALAATEVLRKAIAATSLDDGSVTASFGIAVAKSGRFPEASVLVEAADQALYRAKKSGRNRVEVES